MSLDELRDKENAYIYIYIYIIWINLKGIMLSEINQTEKDKYYIISQRTNW